MRTYKGVVERCVYEQCDKDPEISEQALVDSAQERLREVVHPKCANGFKRQLKCVYADGVQKLDTSALRTMG